MYFPDLGTETQVCSAPFVRAIGWLDPAHPIETGETPEEFRSRLARFAERADDSATHLHWPAAGGSHECHLCGEQQGSGNFGIIAADVLYVCPELVSHYVRAHDYLPPRVFIDAAMECPLPWTARYVIAARRFRSPVATPS